MSLAIREGKDLEHRLAGLRRRIRLVATFRGTAWLVAVVLATLLLAGLLDWRVHLPGLVRAFLLTGLLAAAGIVFRQFLWLTLSEPTDDLSLALRVEERYPGLNDSLASTVEFLGRSQAPEGESASMRREAVRRALGRASGLDFQRVVDSRGLWPAGLCSLAALLPAIALMLLAPAIAGTAVARLALPFSGIEWPRKTRIELDHVTQRIGRNREYRLRGVVKGVLPREVHVDLFYEGFPAQRRTFTVKEEKGEHTFAMHLKPAEVYRSFKFRVSANDAVTPEYAVEVLPLPSLVPLDGKASPQLRLDLPRYTDLPSPQYLPAGNGNIDAVSGTIVTLRAAADRPLRKAWIEYQPETPQAPAGFFLAPLGSASPLGVVASIHLGQAVYQPVPAKLDSDQRRFSVTFRPAVHGNYAIHFEDEHDLANSRVYELRLRPDPAPVVRLDRPSPGRDLLSTVLATAELPLQVAVEDPQYAVRSVWLEYRTRPDEAPRTRLLYHHQQGLARDAVGLTGLGILAAPTPRLRLPRLEFNRTLPLRSLRHADGSLLKEGDVVVLQACADDFDDVSVGKEPGRSPSVEIRIVGRAELESRLNQEQGQIQQELVRLHQKQREALNKVIEVESRLRKGGRMAPEREAAQAEDEAQKARDEAAAEDAKADKAEAEAEKEKHRERAAQLRKQAEELAQKAGELKKQAMQMSEAEELQQQINRRVGDEREGLRAEVDRLRETLQHNGLRNSAAMDRLKMVASELERLAEKELSRIEPKLASARKLDELMDEKRREERRAELEARAKQADKEARAALEQAKKLAEQAEKARESARKSDEPAEAARKEAEAKRLEAQAQQAKQQAAEKRAQAERDTRDARQPIDPNRPRQDLAEARRGQEEVEKSLGSLLQNLEPWSSTREVKGEASRIMQEQKEALAQAEEQAKKLENKTPEQLTREEKADLDQLNETQKRLAERTEQLVEKMERMAGDRAEKDPETAKEMLNAAKAAREGNLAQRMRSAQQNIQNNQLNKAQKEQREAIAELEKMVKNLEDRREAELDRLIKKLREAEKEVEKLMDEQERLQKKLREAGKIADPKKREDEVRRLARRQQELKKKTEELLEQLSRMQSDRARQALGQAADEMGDANQQLRQGKRSDEKQEEVLDRLDEARRELERARKKAEEELGREQITRVIDAIKRYRDRHEALMAEGKRIQDAVLERKGWSRPLRSSLGTLRDAQQGLGEELESIVKKDLSGAPVFARLLDRSVRAMRKAGERFGAMVRQTPELDRLPDEEAGRWQRQALRYLQQLLDSLKEQAEDPRPLSRPGGGQGNNDEEDGARGPQGDDSLPPTAQLKLLHMLQKEVNERTAAFRKKHPDPKKLDEKAKAELQEIRREQKEVADLLEQLTRPAGENPPPDEDDKDEAEKEGENR